MKCVLACCRLLLLSPLRIPALSCSIACCRRRILRWWRKKNKCRILRRLFFFCAHHIITYLHLFFDIFHGLKKIAKKDKPDTAITAALPGLSLIFFISLFFLLPLASLLPVKKLLSSPPEAFPLKKRHFGRSRLFLSAFLERADRFI